MQQVQYKASSPFSPDDSKKDVVEGP